MALSLLRPRFNLWLGDLRFCKPKKRKKNSASLMVSQKKQTNKQKQKTERQRKKEERKALQLGFNTSITYYRYTF